MRLTMTAAFPAHLQLIRRAAMRNVLLLLLLQTDVSAPVPPVVLHVELPLRGERRDETDMSAPVPPVVLHFLGFWVCALLFTELNIMLRYVPVHGGTVVYRIIGV